MIKHTLPETRIRGHLNGLTAVPHQVGLSAKELDRIAPQDELVTIVLTQHMPFSELSQTVKPLVYAAIVE